MVILYKVLPKFTHGWAFQFSKEDLEVLESIFNKRTGKDTLQKTHFGSTTRKSESAIMALQQIIYLFIN